MAKAVTVSKPDIPSGESAAISLGCLNDLIGFHITLAQLTVYRDFCQSLEPLDLTQKQFTVLEIIFSNPDVSQIDISQAIGTDRATMMALVERLDKRGFIDRRQSQHDKRRQQLRLTSLGVEIRNTAADLIRKHEKALFSTLSAKEITTLVATLQKVRGV